MEFVFFFLFIRKYFNTMKINPAELQQIIKEETLRLKKRMMLESEKAQILKKLQEMNECGMGGMMDEEAPIYEAANFGADADKMLATPNFAKAAQNAVVSFYKKGEGGVGDWAKPFFAGKNLQDRNQANQVYQQMLAAYKNLWKNAYVQNKGDMTNMKFDPMTGTFTKSAGPSSGRWFTGLAEDEKK